MKYLKKVQSLPTELEENTLYYSTEDNKVGFKSVELKPTKVWYFDGSYKEFNVTEIVASIAHFTIPFESEVKIPTTQFGAVDTIKKNRNWR